MPRAIRSTPQNLPVKRRLRRDTTPAEKLLWNRLRQKQLLALKFRRQHGVGPYIVDFYCPEKALVIEVDGDSHAEEKQIVKDRQREAYLNSLGLHVVRYTNDDVLKNLDHSCPN